MLALPIVSWCFCKDSKYQVCLYTAYRSDFSEFAADGRFLAKPHSHLLKIYCRQSVCGAAVKLFASTSVYIYIYVCMAENEVPNKYFTIYKWSTITVSMHEIKPEFVFLPGGGGGTNQK